MEKRITQLESKVENNTISIGNLLKSVETLNKINDLLIKRIEKLEKEPRQIIYQNDGRNIL